MIGIIVSDFNQTIVEGLLSGCKKALFEKGYNEKSMIIKKVPGAFEIPAATHRLTAKDEIKVVITLGAVIKGETDHYHYISEAVTNGIMKITLESKIPIISAIGHEPDINIIDYVADLSLATPSHAAKKVF